ncbi:platelet endothelial aggregation receptor 1, partial [Biomphalaria pfeifferi]
MRRTGKWGINCRNTCNDALRESVTLELNCVTMGVWVTVTHLIVALNFPRIDGASTDVCLDITLPDCTRECPEGQWGVNCTSTCNKNCYDKVCNPNEGSCNSGCIEGFQPPICIQECVIGTYGRNCLFTCSSLCVNAECDPVKGACNKCPCGYEGHACDITHQPNDVNNDYETMSANKCYEDVPANFPYDCINVTKVIALF